MTRKTPCPACGEPNYETSPACWKCDAPMRVAPVQAPDSPVAPAPPESPVPPAPPDTVMPQPEPPPEPLAPSEPPTAPQPPSAPNPESRILNPEPKPAELEAQALREKDYVTAPVDVEERPRTPGEWVAYAWAAVGSSGDAFRAALNDYDRRRGAKSGGVSSYGCVVGMLVCAILIVVIVTVVTIMARPVGR